MAKLARMTRVSLADRAVQIDMKYPVADAIAGMQKKKEQELQ
jgi:hypothetical protein